MTQSVEQMAKPTTGDRVVVAIDVLIDGRAYVTTRNSAWRKHVAGHPLVARLRARAGVPEKDWID